MSECCVCAGSGGRGSEVSLCADHKVYRVAWFNSPLPIWGWLHLRDGYKLGTKRNRSVRQGDLSFKPDDSEVFIPYSMFIQDIRRKYKVFLSISQKTDADSEYSYGDLAGGSKDQNWFYFYHSSDQSLIPFDKMNFDLPCDPVQTCLQNYKISLWPVLPSFPASSEDSFVGHKVKYRDAFERSQQQGFVLGYRITYLEGRPLSFFIIKNSETSVKFVKATDVFQETSGDSLPSTLTPEEREVYDRNRVNFDVRPYLNLIRE